MNTTLLYALILKISVAGNVITQQVDTYATLEDCIATLEENGYPSVLSCEPVEQAMEKISVMTEKPGQKAVRF